MESHGGLGAPSEMACWERLTLEVWPATPGLSLQGKSVGREGSCERRVEPADTSRDVTGEPEHGLPEMSRLFLRTRGAERCKGLLSWV